MVPRGIGTRVVELTACSSGLRVLLADLKNWVPAPGLLVSLKWCAGAGVVGESEVVWCGRLGGLKCGGSEDSGY